MGACGQDYWPNRKTWERKQKISKWEYIASHFEIFLILRLKKKGQKAQTYFMVSPLKNALEFFESSYGTTPKRSDRRAPNKFFDNTGLQPNRFDGVLRLSVLNHRKMLLASRCYEVTFVKTVSKNLFPHTWPKDSTWQHMARARGSQPPSPALAYSVIRGLVTNRLMVSPRATLSRITDLKVQPISGYRGWLVRRRRAYIFTQPKNRADLMEYVRPLLKKDFVETMALWPIVRWTVPRLGIAYAWAFPFLPMCRHFQRLAYQSGSFLQSSVHMGPSTLSPARPTS